MLDPGRRSRLLLVVTVSTVCALVLSCNSGTSRDARSTPLAILPDEPDGIGLAGRMAGSWHVVAADLESIEAGETTPTLPPGLRLHSEVEIRGGEVVGPILPQIIDLLPGDSLVVDYELNTTTDDVTVYATGRRHATTGSFVSEQVGLVAGTVLGDAGRTAVARVRHDRVLRTSFGVDERFRAVWVLGLMRRD